MATFRFVGRDINIHWNGYDIVGPAGTVFSIPDQLYEEFESDLRGAEPTLEWIDTNEFLTLTNAVSVTTLQGAFPISVTTNTSGKIIGVTSSSAADGYVLTSDGSGGVAWEALPADATGITSIIGTSPISAAVAATQATISIDQSLITGAAAATNAQTVRTYVKNTTGSSIAKGSAVYVSGATGDNALIALSTASTEVGSSKTLGITSEAIANDAFGYVVESGYLTGIDTNGITAGTPIWLGTTPGSLVYGSPPAEPNHSVYLGVVIREQQNNGSILVKVQNGYELNELHDVFTNGVSTALPLVYSSTSSGWVAQALSSVGIADNAIVAAKIAASAVGTSKIDSGAATNGQILTANGSGGVSFATLLSSSLSITSNTASATLAGCTLDAIEYAGATASSNTFSVGFAVDTASNIAYQISGRNTIRKIDLTANTQMATLTVTANANERLTDIAFGASKLICVSGPTAALGSSQYFIIDPSALTVQNTGNIKEAANYVGTLSVPTAHYDSLLQKFTVHASYTTVTTGVSAAPADTRGTFRIIDPSTYSTRVHTFTTAQESSPASYIVTTSYSNGTFMSHPIWYDTASVFISHRIAGGGTARAFRYYSDSAASTGFLTLAGSSVVGGFASNIAGSLVIEPTTAKANIYAAVIATTTNRLTAIGRMSISTISADFASTGVDTRNFSDITSSTTPTTNGAAQPTASVYPGTGGFDVFNIDGTVYILVGTELYDANLDNKYGNAAFSTTELAGATNALYCGNVIHLYKDGSDIKALISRRGSGASGVHLRRTTFALATSTLTLLDGTNTSPNIIARPIIPTYSTSRAANDYMTTDGSGVYAEISQVGTSNRIYFANTSTNINWKFWSIYGSTETMSINYWKVG